MPNLYYLDSITYGIENFHMCNILRTNIPDWFSITKMVLQLPNLFEMAPSEESKNSKVAT